MISKVDLDFVYAFEDLFGVGFDVRADEEEIFAIVGFMEVEILFHIGKFHVDLGDPDLHMDPDRDDGDQECKQADCLGYWHSKYCGF